MKGYLQSITEIGEFELGITVGDVDQKPIETKIHLSVHTQ